MLLCIVPALVLSPPLPSLKRPRGLWRQRRLDEAVQAPTRSPWPHKGFPSHDHHNACSPSPSTTLAASPSHDSDHDDPADDDRPHSASSASSSKRRRTSAHFDSDSEFAPSPASRLRSISPHSDHSSLYNAAPLLIPPMAPQSISRSTSSASTTFTPNPVHSADYEDWENLKALFAKAAERHDAEDIPQALPLLRAVIRECHRFLIDHPDPSVVYSDHLLRRQLDPSTPTADRSSRDWYDTDWIPPRRSSLACSPRHAELPTAFHAIFGITLFLMGNLVAQDPSIVLPGEPDTSSTYWLAALDVFETGENLPSRTGGESLDTAEDWRMAIVWGRTLVSLADEKVTHNMRITKAQTQAEQCYLPTGAPFSMSEPQWPASSPFHAIAQFRPPVTRRMSLYSASAHDIMVLAMDQFSRGIFHMPHPQYSHVHNPSFIHTSGYFSPTHGPPAHYASPYATSSIPGDGSSVTFSRPRELFTIASEVLGVAERLSSGTQRQYWASWADSVFNQMKNEADMDAWRGPIFSARGRCWLVMGSAPCEEMEGRLERGEVEVLHSAEAEEAREGLAMAISFFERAKGQSGSVTCAFGAGGAERGGEEKGDDVSPLLVEALLVLANLTADENKREELYTRAQTEAREDLGLDARGTEDRMDTS